MGKKKGRKDRRRGSAAERTKKPSQSKTVAYRRDFQKFQEQLNSNGMFIRKMKDDGNCMFRALADQLDGSEHNHVNYRQGLMNFVLENRDSFEPFVEDDENFDDYVESMKQNSEWGGQFELAAAVQYYGITIVIHNLDSPRIIMECHTVPHPNIVHLSYHDNSHYNSVRPIGRDDGPAVDQVQVEGVSAIVSGSSQEAGDWEVNISKAEKRKIKRLEQRKLRQQSVYKKGGKKKTEDRPSERGQTPPPSLDKLGDGLGTLVV